MKQNYNCLMALIVLFIFLLANTQCAIMPPPATDRKCYGNFVLVGTRCTACKVDEVAQNNVCVKLASAQYGTNIKNVSVGSNATQSSQPTNKTADSKCVNFNSTNPSLCIKCVGNHDIIYGKCVESSCKIYSQLLGKCIDNPTQADLLFLSFQNQNQPKPNNASNSSGEGYIVGLTQKKLNIMIADNSVPLTLGVTLAIRLNVTNLQLTEITTENPPPANSTTNSTNI